MNKFSSRYNKNNGTSSQRINDHHFSPSLSRKDSDVIIETSSLSSFQQKQQKRVQQQHHKRQSRQSSSLKKMPRSWFAKGSLLLFAVLWFAVFRLTIFAASRMFQKAQQESTTMFDEQQVHQMFSRTTSPVLDNFKRGQSNNNKTILGTGKNHWSHKVTPEVKQTPLVDPLIGKYSNHLRPIDAVLKPDVPYLGVLLDGGRHYFPVPWIKNMINTISVMGYNMIHFRLTDDQVFNVQLESQPQLAYPSRLGGNTKVYSPQELKDIVQYAKSKGIVIVPEINVPGHAASWGGIPELIVQCPEFICSRGYGIPLNVSSPILKPILTDVVTEVVNIFDHPPFLVSGPFLLCQLYLINCLFVISCPSFFLINLT
jgi:hypothetical protein